MGTKTKNPEKKTMDCPSTPTKGVCLQFDDFKNEKKMNINSPIKKRLEERRKPESPSMKDVLKKQQEAEDRRQKQLENVKAKAAKSCTPKKKKPSSSATPFTPTKFPVCIQIDIKDPTKANIDSPVKKRLEKRAAGYESPKLTTSLDKVMERQKRAEERRM